jgi:ubiquitin fusion degradation protein 1
MFGMNFFNDVPRPFRTQYRCYSVSMLPGNERKDLEHGGKIIMPPSALDQLTR